MTTYSLVLVLLALILLAVLVAIINFRFLLYRYFPSLNAIAGLSQVTLKGSALFISDLHLRGDRPFKHSENLRHFVEQRHVSNLIIVGDLFNTPKDAKIILAERSPSPILSILGVNGLPVQVFLVEGSPPHDPSQGEQLMSTAPFILLGRCAVFSIGSLRMVAYHGHDLSRKGALGHGWDRFISKLSLERAWKRAAGVAESDWVIFGHTHIPGIDSKNRVANCGGWQSIGFLVRPACTGIYVTPESGSVELVKFE
jgi:UDP-2,3-diacylglucosamine pyrophosphatase LpxH